MWHWGEDHTDNMDMSEDPSNNAIPLDVEAEMEKYLEDIDEVMAMEDLDEVKDEPLMEEELEGIKDVSSVGLLKHCLICGIDMTVPSGLKKHMKLRHPDGMSDAIDFIEPAGNTEMEDQAGDGNSEVDVLPDEIEESVGGSCEKS